MDLIIYKKQAWERKLETGLKDDTKLRNKTSLHRQNVLEPVNDLVSIAEGHWKRWTVEKSENSQKRYFLY